MKSVKIYSIPSTSRHVKKYLNRDLNLPNISRISEREKFIMNLQCGILKWFYLVLKWFYLVQRLKVLFVFWWNLNSSHLWFLQIRKPKKLARPVGSQKQNQGVRNPAFFRRFHKIMCFQTSPSCQWSSLPWGYRTEGLASLMAVRGY